MRNREERERESERARERESVCERERERGQERGEMGVFPQSQDEDAVETVRRGGFCGVMEKPRNPG